MKNKLGITGGLFLSADGSESSYGTSLISGFERLLITATSFGDRIEGGVFSDLIGGNVGNDVLYGGNDSARDWLLGEDGDDTVLWHNNGSDLLDGGARTAMIR